MNKLVTTNNRVERLATVFEVLKFQAPVNLYSTVLIVADPKHQNQWRFAARRVRQHWQLTERFVRAVEVIDFEEFDKRCGLPWDDQHIFVVDDTDPAIYPALRKSMQKLKLDDGHRLFMTKVAKEDQ